MTIPLVSVVIPCYNTEKYVGEAIRSALSQTYPNVEVIVVDDGSTDGSLDVIRSFGDAIRWESGVNRGGSAARNRGVELARGELIQFLDADDLLHARKLEVHVDAALRYRPAIPICDYETIDEHGEQYLNDVSHPTNDPVVRVARRPFQTSAPLHWKELLLAVGGFRVGLTCWQEDDLHFRLACAGASFYHVPEVLFTWRRVTHSITDNWPRVVDYQRRIYLPLFKELKRAGKLTNERALALGSAVACYAYHYLHMGMTTKAMVTFRRARKMHPDAVLDGTETFYRSRFHRIAYRFLDPVCAHCIIRILSFPQRAGRAVQRLLPRILDRGILREIS
jgi:glycosyltransferase involved in cell wall biosynthesis